MMVLMDSDVEVNLEVKIMMDLMDSGVEVG